MILGIGSDLTDIRRIEALIGRFGEKILRRLFTAAERERAEQRAGDARMGAYAKRFAAKEAASKALGTGIAKGITFLDFEVCSLPGGQPVLKISGTAAQILAERTPQGYYAQVHLSLSDEWPMAQAFVVLSAVPDFTAKTSLETL